LGLDDGAAGAEATGGEAGGAGAADGEVAEGIRAGGPFDVSERPETVGMVDFGSIRLPLDRSAKISVEVSRETGRPVAVVVSKDGSRLQLMALAAPKRGGIWQEVMRQQQGAITREGGVAKEADGRFGPELVAQVPTTTAQGRQGKQNLRFIGADGPRWLLRGVLGGKAAAAGSEAAVALEGLFSQVVVVRGSEAMPPREFLPLRLPTAAKAAVEGEDAADKDDPTALLKRGPEITEVR
jgi:hypothetical protein